MKLIDGDELADRLLADAITDDQRRVAVLIGQVIEDMPEAQPECDGDLIRRQAAIDVALNFFVEFLGGAFHENCQKEMIARFQRLPSVQPKPEVRPISYDDCANAMLKMWMENVITDGEYYRIMDKLNAWKAEKGEQDG